MGWWSKLWKKRAEDWTYERLNPSQVPDGEEHQEVTRESAYLNIWLKSMRVVNVRKGFAKFYGTVHSHTSLLHVDRGEITVQTVTTPNALKDVDAKNVDRIISINHRLLGPIPYRGGDLELELGLFSVKSVDLAGPYIDLLGDLANAAGVSVISTALPFVGPIKTGVALLTGTENDSILEIGLSRVYNPVETGWYLAMRCRKGEVDTSQVRVGNDYKVVDSAGKVIVDYPYLLFMIEASVERDDWFLIPEVADAYRALQVAVRKGQVQEAEDAFTGFRLITLTSPDLLRNDAQRLVEKVEREVKDVLGTALTSSKVAELPPLENINLYH